MNNQRHFFISNTCSLFLFSFSCFVFIIVCSGGVLCACVVWLLVCDEHSFPSFSFLPWGEWGGEGEAECSQGQAFVCVVGREEDERRERKRGGRGGIRQASQPARQGRREGKEGEMCACVGVWVCIQCVSECVLREHRHRQRHRHSQADPSPLHCFPPPPTQTQTQTPTTYPPHTHHIPTTWQPPHALHPPAAKSHSPTLHCYIRARVCRQLPFCTPFNTHIRHTKAPCLAVHANIRSVLRNLQRSVGACERGEGQTGRKRSSNERSQRLHACDTASCMASGVLVLPRFLR